MTKYTQYNEIIELELKKIDTLFVRLSESGQNLCYDMGLDDFNLNQLVKEIGETNKLIDEYNVAKTNLKNRSINLEVFKGNYTLRECKSYFEIETFTQKPVRLYIFY